MKIHKEGYATIALSLLALVILNGLFSWLFPAWFASLLGLALFVVFFLVVWFFRIPERVANLDDSKILCPADGEVVVIEETEETEWFHDRRIQVSIFMSPLNVHQNRVPMAGKVAMYKYHPGKFLVAWHPKSSTENERTTVVIDNEKGTQILVRQIAGAVARRIVCYMNDNMDVKQGDELGFIKFGSRVDVYLPLSAKVNVQIGQKVTSNIDHIATL